MLYYLTIAWVLHGCEHIFYTIYQIGRLGFSKMTSNPLVFLVHFETHLHCLAVMMILDPALITNQHSWSEGPFLMVYVMKWDNL